MNKITFWEINIIGGKVMKYFIVTIIVTIALFLVGCKHTDIHPDSTFNYQHSPVLVPNESLSTKSRPVYMQGPIYPSNNGTSFELDAPVIPNSNATNAGRPYYGFELNIQVTGLRYLNPVWHNGDSAINVEKVEGPCSHQNERILMNTRSEHSRGIRAPASYNLIIDNKLSQGRPVYWITCHDNIEGEVIKNNNGTTVTSLVAFLIPKALVSSNSSMHLTAMPLVGGQESEPLVINIKQSPFMMSVIGDSVAWGQGIRPADNYTQRLFRDLVGNRDTEDSGRYKNFAHSGAVLRSRSPSIGFQDKISGLGGTSEILNNVNNRFDILNEKCSKDRLLYGEVPRSSPSIQCQVLESVTKACIVEDVVNGIPQFNCSTDNINTANSDTLLALVDTRPRWDYVVMDGCVNDMDGTWIHTAIGIADSRTGELINRTNQKCNLTHGLKDVREFLPNAIIVFHSYHRIIDQSSIQAIKQGCRASATNIFNGLPFGIIQQLLKFGNPVNDVVRHIPSSVPDSILNHLPGEVSSSLSGRVLHLSTINPDWVADRSSLFIATSEHVQMSSINTLNQIGNGVGKFIFVSMLPVFPEGQAAFSPNELVFSLDCSTPTFEPLDTEYGIRRQACAEQAAQEGFPANSKEEEKCKRASVFHPNLQAQELMFQRIKEVMLEQNVYP